MKNAVVEEVEELGKGSDSSLWRKPNLCSVHKYRRTCENTAT